MPINKSIGLLLSAEYKTNDENRSEINLYVKTSKGIEKFIDSDFLPYLYAKVTEEKKAVEELNGFEFDGAKIIKIEKEENRKELNLIKIYFSSTADLSKSREKLRELNTVIELHEFDILYPKRYLFDKGITPFNEIEVMHENNLIKSVKEIESDKAVNELKMLAFDLETYSPGRFSNAELDAILTLSIYSKKIQKVITYKKEFEKINNTIIVKDEKELIQKFIELIKEEKPEVIITYNGDSFDFPYLKTRAEKFKLKLPIGFNESEPKTKKVSLFTAEKLLGVQHLDAFQMVKFLARIAVINSSSLDLETVVEKVFGLKKEKLASEKINEIWETGKECSRLVEYNLEDSKTTFMLAERFLPLFIELGKLTKQNLFDVTRSSSSQNVEMLLMQESLKQGKLFANKPSEGEVKKRMLAPIKGGYVKEPLPGLHERIAVMDFRSLYPSIIISHNVSPETICSHKECSKNISPEGICFCEKEKGIVPNALEKVLNKRIEVKKELKKTNNAELKKILDAKQHALKILLNSTYGTLVFPRFRWYSRECGKSITAWARKYIQEVMDKAEKNGFTSLYGDTDSSFLLIPKNKNESDVKKFIETINTELPGAMELEFEGFFKRGIFVTKKEGGAAKKRYALIDFKDNMKIVGFEFVRRDWAIIAKRMQGKALELILKEGTPEKAIQLVKETINNLREGKVPKKDLIILTQLKKPINKYELVGPHIAAAKKAVEKGKKLTVGSTLGFIITRNGKSISDKAELSEFVEEGNYDKDYYIEHQIIPAVQRIIEELGYSKQDLIIGGKQKTLFSFN
ncbi:MAG: ribonuclease H-like domain-containing protein [Candidatus Diapherotrites archaeon]|nr:ribonuclease H-like domain-containing protein [Candidatus Diapherotrites archaeon]